VDPHIWAATFPSFFFLYNQNYYLLSFYNVPMYVHAAAGKEGVESRNATTFFPLTSDQDRLTFTSSLPFNNCINAWVVMYVCPFGMMYLDDIPSLPVLSAGFSADLSLPLPPM
jgi:hypothetical protein